MFTNFYIDLAMFYCNYSQQNFVREFVFLPAIDFTSNWLYQKIIYSAIRIFAWQTTFLRLKHCCNSRAHPKIIYRDYNVNFTGNFLEIQIQEMLMSYCIEFMAFKWVLNRPLSNPICQMMAIPYWQSNIAGLNKLHCIIGNNHFHKLFLWD